MLTKELLAYRVRQSRIAPLLVPPDDAASLQRARELLAIFTACEGRTLGELEQESFDLCGTADLFSSGARRVLLSLCKTREATEDVLSRRWALIEQAQKARAEGVFPSLAGFVDHMGGEDAAQNLYADLPESLPIAEFPEIAPDQLLHRYNLVNIQSLLLYARALRMHAQEVSLGEKRGLIRTLKFYRLCAQFEDTKENELAMQLTGPLALTNGGAGYGLRLAMFFAHVVHLAHWQCEATLRDPRRRRDGDLTLKLSSKLGLQSHVKQRLAYVPEEWLAFLADFNDRKLDWTAALSGASIRVPGMSPAFADLEFAHKNGKTVYLELFHKWHMGDVARRLGALRQGVGENIIVGVCRSLIKAAKDVKIEVESPAFQEIGFLFTDFPSAKPLLSLLKERE